MKNITKKEKKQLIDALLLLKNVLGVHVGITRHNEVIVNGCVVAKINVTEVEQ